MVTSILMVRNTLGCLSSGISFCKQSEFVNLLILNKINIAKIIKTEMITESLLNCHFLLTYNNKIFYKKIGEHL